MLEIGSFHSKNESYFYNKKHSLKKKNMLAGIR